MFILPGSNATFMCEAFFVNHDSLQSKFLLQGTTNFFKTIWVLNQSDVQAAFSYNTAKTLNAEIDHSIVFQKHIFLILLQTNREQLSGFLKKWMKERKFFEIDTYWKNIVIGNCSWCETEEMFWLFLKIHLYSNSSSECLKGPP